MRLNQFSSIRYLGPNMFEGDVEPSENSNCSVFNFLEFAVVFLVRVRSRQLSALAGRYSGIRKNVF